MQTTDIILKENYDWKKCFIKYIIMIKDEFDCKLNNNYLNYHWHSYFYKLLILLLLSLLIIIVTCIFILKYIYTDLVTLNLLTFIKYAL